MGRDTDGPLPSLEGFDHMIPTHLLFNPLPLVGGCDAVHHHIVEKVLAVILKCLPCEDLNLFCMPSSQTHSFDIFPDIPSCLWHQEIEEVSYDHTKKLLNRPRDESRKELKEREVDESIEGLDVALLNA